MHKPEMKLIKFSEMKGYKQIILSPEHVVDFAVPTVYREKIIRKTKR